MRIVIVEDELQSLRHISSAVAKLDRSYEVVGQARSGAAGIEVILRELPDVVITDIRMPGMNGLEMMEQVISHCPHTRFIILSGHADFNYARQAIQMGTADYLLKPVSLDEMHRALQKAQGDLEDDRKIRAQLPSSLPDEHLLAGLLSAQGQQWEVMGQELDRRIGGSRCMRLLLARTDHALAEQIRRLVLEKLGEIAGSHTGCRLFFDTTAPRSLLLLLAAPDEMCAQRVACDALEEIRARTDGQVVCCMLRLADRRDILPAKNRLDALSHWQLSFPEQPLLTEDAAQQQVQPYAYPTELERELTTHIAKGEFPQASAAIHRFSQSLAAGRYHHRDIRSAMIRMAEALLFAVRLDYFGLYGDLDSLGVLEFAGRCLILPCYTAMLGNILSRTADYSQRVDRCGHPVINKALQVIRCEFQSDLSLDSMAERLGISAEYFSSLFTKEIGVSFIAYLTQCRMEHAKTLLKDNRKVYEVATACGYHDVRYFSKVFKKHMGMSPGEYVRG